MRSCNTPRSVGCPSEGHPVAELLLILLGSFVVGILGALLGVGGGTFLVPFLVLLVQLEPVAAVGVSLFCVIGTSVGAASSALKRGQANIGLALSIEPIMLVASVGASLLAQRMGGALLLALFALMMLGVSGLFFRLWRTGHHRPPVAPSEPARLDDGAVLEPGATEPVRYRPQRRLLLSTLIGLTGAASGLFGIGGGVVNVPLLSLVGRVPLRAATATSVLTLTITGASAGAVHLAYGSVPGALVGIALVGVVPGGMIGARLQRLLPERTLRLLFACLALVVAVLTFRRAWELS